MKNCTFTFFLLFSFSLIKGSANYPITVIIKNETKQSLSVSLEYEVDQHYTRRQGPGTPFIPNNTRFHTPEELSPGKTRTIHVFAFSPCAKEYCALAYNLENEGFIEHYKVIQGSITIGGRKRSYDFKESVLDGAIIRCNITLDGVTISTIKGLKTTKINRQIKLCTV